MSELTFEVKEFIEDNIDLIEQGAWSQIYDNAFFTLDSTATGKFTQAILSIGEDPLIALDYIPEYYLSDCNIETFTIPNHILELYEGCFSYSSLKDIVIPDSVTTIGMYAFYDCTALERVKIPPNVISIEDNSFNNSKTIVVCKKGSYAEQYAQENQMNVEYY